MSYSSVNNNNLYWFKKDTPEPYSSLYSYFRYLDTNQSYRNNDNIVNMRLYGNSEIQGMGTFNYLRTESSYNTQNRVTMNIIQSMVDTVHSKITKNKPKPTFLTSGGDWTLQKKAKNLTKFVEGQFYATDFYTKSSFAFLDACIFGTGAVKIYKNNSKIQCERVFIDELYTDDVESMYGEPRQLVQRKFIHKDVLKEMFPGYEKEIEVVNTQVNLNDMPRNNMVDMVLVLEAWHLKSGDEATDGKHMIAIENCVLFEEEWDKDYFPFVFFRWGRRPLGFYGQGLADQLRGLQVEINKILRTIQVSMHLVSVPKIFVPMGSNIVTAHLNNKIGGIIKYSGNPPTEGKLGSIPVELFTHLDKLYTRAYEIAGVSQLSAGSTKPAGLDSGKALREYNDLETERFMNVAQSYEHSHMTAAKMLIDFAKEIDEEMREKDGSSYEVTVKGKKFMEKIRWKDINLEDDEYMMQVFPTSSLSSTPSGRLNDVQDLLKAGFVSKEDAMKLLNFPDLEQYYNIANAGVEDIERTIEKIVDDSDYETPEPYQNLVYGIQKMQSAYLYYKANGMKDSQLELFRRWISEANELLQKAQQPPEQPPVAAPQGNPTAIAQEQTGAAVNPADIANASTLGNIPQQGTPQQ